MTRVVGAAFLSLLPALVLGQSLGEVAKKEQERRKRNQSNGASVRKLTDEDIARPAEPIEEASPDPSIETPVIRNERSTAASTTSGTTSGAAPSFTLEDRRGRRVSLSDFRGKIVLVDFWATWCGPCRHSMPKVEKIHRRYRARGLQVIGINIEGPSKDVLDYIDEGGYSFLFLFDKGNWRSDVVQSYGVRSIPRSFLIDRQGNLIYAGHPGHLPEAVVELALQ